MASGWKLEHVQVSCGTKETPTATVVLFDPEGKEYHDATVGVGPVDAVYKAINKIVRVPNNLTEYHVDGVTQGLESPASVMLVIERDGRDYKGRGQDKDTIVASAYAYMEALNKLIVALAIDDAVVAIHSI